MPTGIIDETFLGLERPRQTVNVGRPEIQEGRPGEILVAEVRQFIREGGRDQLREARAADVREVTSSESPAATREHGHRFNVPSNMNDELSDPKSDAG